jgi:hypothetical protein
MAKKLNTELTRMVAELNEAPFDGSKSLERCELFLLAAAYAGTTSPTKIASASGLSRSECSALANTARSSGIFSGYKIAGADWLDPKTGGIAFIMDAMVLDGTLEREPA